MSAPCLLLGGGGHARVLADALLAAGVPAAGYVAPEDRGTLPGGARWRGDDDWLAEQAPDAFLLACALGGTGDNAPRARLHRRFRMLGFRFLTVRHPAAVVGSEVLLGEGAQLLPGAVVHTGARLGENVLVNTRAVVEHDCRIGDHVHIAPGAVLCGGCRVDEGAHIGAGAVVLQGRVIGAGAIVAAGATVIRDVEPSTRVRGVPAVAAQPSERA